MESNSHSASGQGVERFAAILRILAERSAAGSRLTDVAMATGLNKTTVHRTLANLVAERFVEVDEQSGLYFLSFSMFALGMAAGDRYNLATIAREKVNWLEERTGDTVFLSMRAGTEAVCIDRAAGTFPIKVLTLNIGDRRPLGVGAGSLALLAALDDVKIDQVIERNKTQLRNYANFTPAKLHGLVERTRKNGFAFNDGMIVPGMQAIGIAIPEKLGPPRAALSIAATSERMSLKRQKDLVTDIKSAADDIGKHLSLVGAARFDI